MSTVALTTDTFEDTVTREGITLVDWWASWCGPCRMFAPVFAAASDQHQDITFGKVDTEDQSALADAARITSIPTLMAFRDGILVFSQPGAEPVSYGASVTLDEPFAEAVELSPGGTVETNEQAAWDQRYSGQDLVWGAGPNRFVADELTALPPGRAVDLGSGEGRNAIWLAERGWRVTAVDFSAGGLARARRLAAERGISVDWVQADLLAWQPEPGGYDLVLIAYLHLPSADLARVFRAAAAAVAPGGTLLVVGHDRDNIARGHGGPQDPDRLYTPAAVTAELGGLDIHRAERVPRPVRTPEGERAAIDTLVRAERPAQPA